MPSPNFDLANVELSRRIGDPVASASTDGKVLTDTERDAYVNKAMHKLVADILLSVQGDNEKFIEIFPELFTSASVSSDASAQVDVTDPLNSIADFFKLVEGVYSSTYIKVLPKHLFNIVQLGLNANYTPSATNLFAFEIDNTITFLPVATLASQTITINYIKRPVKSDGTFYANGGATDIPFYPHWISKIAEIAEELVRIDRQFQS